MMVRALSGSFSLAPALRTPVIVTFPIKVVVEKPLANSLYSSQREKTRQSAAVFSEILKTFTGNRVEILGVSDVSNQ